MTALSSSASKPLPSRRSRRTTVVLTYAAIAELTAFSATADAAGAGPIVREILFYSVIPAAIVAFIVLKRIIREIANLPGAKLDERNWSVKTQNYG